jgi:pimeloyl-ACP methyl ester carboxylesterase
MTVALVHGNPETAAIWDELRAHLGRDDVVCLSPPGFGVPAPAGFGATSDEYVAWLAGEVEKLPAPVDLVGHDLGGGHVIRLACERPDLIRSWTTDVAGGFDPEYVWHDFAQVWQTPGAGEHAIAAMLSQSQPDRTAQFMALGMSKAVAESCAAASNAEMGRCILAVYRSAAQPSMSEFGKQQLPKAKARPGLVIVATEDHFTGGEVLARRSAERAGAKVAVLPGLGHWWMCQDPAKGAEVLREFLGGLG